MHHFAWNTIKHAWSSQSQTRNATFSFIWLRIASLSCNRMFAFTRILQLASLILKQNHVLEGKFWELEEALRFSYSLQFTQVCFQIMHKQLCIMIRSKRDEKLLVSPGGWDKKHKQKLCSWHSQGTEVDGYSNMLVNIFVSLPPIPSPRQGFPCSVSQLSFLLHKGSLGIETLLRKQGPCERGKEPSIPRGPSQGRRVGAGRQVCGLLI